MVAVVTEISFYSIYQSMDDTKHWREFINSRQIYYKKRMNDY